MLRMTTVVAVAAALALTFALGSMMIRQVDGPTLRRWRLSRRWDVSRLAREFIAAADEPLATVRGLMHMINAWERGVRKPSERYWLLYLRVFPECAIGEMADGDAAEGVAQDGIAEVNATETPLPSSADGVEHGDVHALAATVRTLEQQIARLSKRLEELSRDGRSAGKPHQTCESSKRRSGHLRGNWTPLLLALIPSVAP